MSETIIIHACPNRCSDATFTTTAHVMQEWEVDAFGAFIETTDDCLQVTYGPDNDNIWSCSKCGAEAKEIECRHTKVKVLSDGSEKTVDLYVERNTPSGQVPYAFMTTPATPKLQACTVFWDDKGDYFVLYESIRIDL